MKRREKHMKEQNCVYKEKDSNTQRQETEEIAGREKLVEGAIRKTVKQGEICEEKSTQIVKTDKDE